MQSTKNLLTQIPRISKVYKPLKSFPIKHTRNMSLFPRFPASEFAPVFRLLDDYDSHRASRTSNAIRGFQPKFDVREIKNAYELHGELPGLDRKDVNIEFSDPHTLVVSGHVEHEYSHGNEHENEGNAKSHKVTVEDDADANDEKATSNNNKAVVAPSKQADSGDEPTYWVTERSKGEFHRSFSFPSRVDQDNVKASLKNGILNIVVPKAAAHQSRKVTID